MTSQGDVVLVYMDNTPAFFARVEYITPDIKPEWFHIKLLVLQMPLLVVTWILKEAYYNGDEFTMGGHPMRIEKVVTPDDEQLTADSGQSRLEKKEPPKPSLVEPKKAPKVVSIFDRRKKDQEPQ